MGWRPPPLPPGSGYPNGVSPMGKYLSGWAKDADQWVWDFGQSHVQPTFDRWAADGPSDFEKSIPVFGDWAQAATDFAKNGWGSPTGWYHVVSFSGQVALLGLGGGEEPAGEPGEFESPAYCFPAGTLVGTFTGLKAIETVKAGERVWAYDLIAGEWRACRVIQTFRRRYDGHSVFVTAEGDTIESTLLHPFWVVRGEGLAERPIRPHLHAVPAGAAMPGRWVDAGDLRAGDELLLREGRTATVDAVRPGPFHDLVYNFQVAELACYSVGQIGALVHNDNGVEDPLPHDLELTERDPQWPWRGLHETEDHHPLMEGPTFRQFWHDRGLTDQDVEGWTVPMDQDVHQGMEKAGWWQGQMFDRIDARETDLDRLLNPDEVRQIANDLLQEVKQWSP